MTNHRVFQAPNMTYLTPYGALFGMGSDDLNVDVTRLESLRLGPMVLRFERGWGDKARAFGEFGTGVYLFLSEMLRTKPVFELVVLSKSDWAKAFGRQPYGDPVTPGDGRVYFGRGVPDSWKEVVRLTGFPAKTLTEPFFQRTLAHEVGHLFSNELMGFDARQRMDRDYFAGDLEILWLIESFSQLCQVLYLEKSRDSFQSQWIELYQGIFDSIKPHVRYRNLTEWGSKVVRQGENDPRGAHLNYVYFQAKCYLLCRDLNHRVGYEALPALARVIKEMGYPVTNRPLLTKSETNAPWLADYFDRWKMA